MATFSLEDTTGAIECICFKYEDFENIIEEDAIVKIKGKFEHSDRGDQIVAFEIEKIELNEKDALPVCLELKIASSDFSQQASLRLNQILKSHPGRDGVTLMIHQSDGRKFRAQLPLTVDSQNVALKSEIHDLFGDKIWAL